MNSRKNPPCPKPTTPLRALASAAALLVSATGCSTLFSRGEAPDAKADGKEAYSATEPASGEANPEMLKDDKIQYLQSTVATLNTRIQELEGRLQASQNRPNLSADPIRQNLGGANAGSEVRASVAANDPGAGYANDERFRAFQQGKILFDQEKYPEAILAFSAFLERAADHPLAGSAQYYIGESYYLQGDFAVADQEFQRVVVRYPGSPRVSYALVRLAQSTNKLGKAEESRRYRAQVEGLYPKSPALLELRKTDFSAAPTATAGAIAPASITIEKPSVPDISIPEVAVPNIDRPSVEAPSVEAPRVNSSSSDLDGPPGGG